MHSKRLGLLDKFPVVTSFPRVLYEGKEAAKPGWQVLETTPYSRSASVSSGGPTTHRTFLMYRRAPDSQALNTLGVTDIALFLPSKGETVPHTFCRVDKNLNTGMVSSERVVIDAGVTEMEMTPWHI